MLITNQDRDNTYYILSTVTEEKYYKNLLMGYNIYGWTAKKKHLLGTYDTLEDAQQIEEEINRLKGRHTHYYMPEPSTIEEEDVFEMLGGAGA